MFRDLSREENVPLIELLALFPEARSWPDLLDKFGLGWNPHLNGVAHERWGTALFELISQKGYVSGGTPAP